MNFSVDSIPNFKKEAKKLIKKYRSLIDELEGLEKKLANYPRTGIHLGNDVYKIKLAVKSKGKGKRGGARVITNVKIISSTVYMLSIYSKGEKDDITDKELKELIKEVPE